MFLLTVAFVGYSGYSFTWQWFTRLDDFYAGVPGPVAPSSALLVELRQRQLLTVLSRNAPRGSQSTMASPRGSGARVRPEEPQLDLSVIDAMYEQAMAGPVCGPLLRLFLAEYIRYVVHPAGRLLRRRARSRSSQLRTTRGAAPAPATDCVVSQRTAG